jgi:hypothetical protein
MKFSEAEKRVLAKFSRAGGLVKSPAKKASGKLNAAKALRALKAKRAAAKKKAKS